MNSKIQCWLNPTSFLSIQFYLYISSHVNTVKKELLTLHLEQRRLRLKYKLRPHICNYFLSDLLLTICPLFSEFKTPSVWGSPIIFGARVWAHCEIQIQTSRQSFRELLLKHGRSLMVRALQLILLYSMKTFTFVRNFYQRNISNTDPSSVTHQDFWQYLEDLGTWREHVEESRLGNVEH